jgi:DNA polymerase III epsilon subunit-like protein
VHKDHRALDDVLVTVTLWNVITSKMKEVYKQLNSKDRSSFEPVEFSSKVSNMAIKVVKEILNKQ